jgi:hypothetical protein
LLSLKATLDFINPPFFSSLTSLALVGLVLTCSSLASNTLTDTVSVPVVSSIKKGKKDLLVVESILVLIVLLS